MRHADANGGVEGNSGLGRGRAWGKDGDMKMCGGLGWWCGGVALRVVCLGWLLVAGASGRLMGAEAMVEMLRSTCRVTHDGRSGTGFFVGRGSDRFLVTAAHVFEESGGAECRLIVRQGKEGGGFERRELPIVVRREGKPLWKRDTKEDVAAIRVELPPTVDAMAIPVERFLNADGAGNSRVEVGQDVWLPGYPAQLEANPAGWPVLRRGMIATHPLSPVASVPTMLVDIRSFGGDSGGPLFVLVDGKPHVAGVIVGMQRQTDRTVSPFEERTVHTPLGLGIAVQADLVARVIGGL